MYVFAVPNPTIVKTLNLVVDDEAGGDNDKERKSKEAKKNNSRLTDSEYREDALKEAKIESAANYACPKGKNKPFCPCANAKKEE